MCTYNCALLVLLLHKRGPQRKSKGSPGLTSKGIDICALARLRVPRFWVRPHLLLPLPFPFPFCLCVAIAKSKGRFWASICFPLICFWVGLSLPLLLRRLQQQRKRAKPRQKGKSWVGLGLVLGLAKVQFVLIFSLCLEAPFELKAKVQFICKCNRGSKCVCCLFFVVVFGFNQRCLIHLYVCKWS